MGGQHHTNFNGAPNEKACRGQCPLMVECQLLYLLRTTKHKNKTQSDPSPS